MSFFPSRVLFRRAALAFCGVSLLAAPCGVTGEKPATYGKTPDTAIPYRNFHEPYARFYQEAVPFLGTGRDKELQTPPPSLRVGFFGPMGKAPDADLGQAMLEGVQLAMEQANAAPGTPFELVVRKDSGLWGASSNEMTAFRYADDVLAVLGSIDGANTHIALRVALKIEMPMVNTATTDPTLTETRIPWLLRCMADDRQQGYALAYHIFRECGIKSVVAFRVNDRYGRTGIIEFRDAARRLGFPVRAELRWDLGERDFSRQLDRIALIAPEAVVIWGNSADAAAVVQAIRRRNMPLRIFGSDRLACRAFLEAAGEAAENVATAASYDPTRQDTRLSNFTAAYQKRFKHPPETFAAHAYDGANILFQAIRGAGPNRARIRDALAGFTHYDGVTGSIEFDTTLNDVGPVYIATVKNGRFIYNRMVFAMNQETPAEPYRTMAQSPSQARSPDEGAAEAVHRIGCFLPLNESGEAVVRGMRRAIAEDLDRNPMAAPIELLIEDTRAKWGDNADALVDFVYEDRVMAVVGSTERRGSHLAETLAAKVHFPIVSLCGTDPTITQIPLPWVFSLARPEDGMAGRSARDPEQDPDWALGYDAAVLLIQGIRGGNHSRKQLRDALAGGGWHEGLSGTFRFDALGNRIER